MRIRLILLAACLLCIPAVTWAVDTASVMVGSKASPILFAAEEIRSALKQAQWAEFAAAVIRNCGGPDSSGFVMGSEIEVPGIDRNHTEKTAGHKVWKYEFEKNWTGPAAFEALVSTWPYEPRLPAGLKAWMQSFNNRVMANMPATSFPRSPSAVVSTNFVLAETGTGIITLRSDAVASAKINGQPARVVGAAPSQSIVGPVRIGVNCLELSLEATFAPPSITGKVVVPRDAQFLEAESGKVTAPFEVAPLIGTSGGTIVRIPKGKGRGESNGGKIVDNGWITYEVELPADGNYVVHVAAFWPDTSANSFHYAWDSAAPRMLGNDETFQTWHWVATASEKLRAGKHTLTIRNRDEGSTFDCLLIAPAATNPSAAMLDNYYERLAAPHRLKYKSLEEWKVRRQEVRKAVLRAIGLDPLPEKLPLDVTYGGQLDRGDYLVKRIYWQTWPDVYASGYLYLPKAEGMHPAMLSPHGHLALGTRDPQEQTRSIALAKKGYVSLAIDSVHLPETCFLIGASSIGVMTYNAMRGLDLLETLPEVDASRIGCNGMSGGGQQTAYMMAVDDRVAIGVPVVLVSWFRKIMNPAGFPHCICNIVPGLLRDVDMPEMVATFAPKPAFYECVTGDWEADFPTDEYPEIQAIYALYQAKSEVGVRRWVSGHDYNQPMREQAYAFFNKYLKRLDDPARAAEPGIQTESLETLATLDKPPAKAKTNQAILDWYRSRYGFRPLEPKDAAGWQAWQKDLRERVATLVGDVAVVGELAGSAEPFDFLGARGRKLLVRSEGGIEIPVLLATPTEDTASPLVILICDKGIRGAIEEQEPLLSALLASKSAVAIAEVRLTGRMKRNWELDSILFGRPEVGMAVTDLRACLDVLAGQRGVDPKRMKLVGLGGCGVTAVFAAAMEPRLTAIAAPDLGATYRRGRSKPLIANIHRVADLPQLIAAATPRDMLVGGVDAGDFADAVAAYQAMNSESKLELHRAAVNITDVVRWIER